MSAARNAGLICGRKYGIITRKDWIDAEEESCVGTGGVRAELVRGGGRIARSAGS